MSHTTGAARQIGRWRPLWLSLWVSLAFVVGRVVFRVFFGGAPGEGWQLPSLPRVDLGGFFSSVNLFGPVTLGGLAQTVVMALPLAAVIVASGLLFSLIDVRRLIVRTRRWGGGSASLAAVLVALAVLPELRATAVRLARARRLRSHRRNFTGVIAPLVGVTVERATALAASLESRGFMNASVNIEPQCAAPISASNVCLRTVDGHAVLTEVTFSLLPGTVTLLTGNTGSGKTTLLRALAGLGESVDGIDMSGAMSVGGVERRGRSARVTANFVAYVPQDVRAGFIGVTVAEEVGMTLTLRGEHRYQVDARVSVVARDMGIGHLLERPVTDLSAGEATLVSLAAALIGAPSVLLIDEPFADLDDDALARVSSTLRDLATRTGITLVIAEHRIAPLAGLDSMRLHIAHGTVRTVDLDFAEESATRSAHAAIPDVSTDWSDCQNFSRPVALVGPNGSGKTTRLWRLALPAGERARGIRLVPENPRDLFTRESVAEECRTQDRQHRASVLASGGALQRSSLELVHDILGDTIDVNVHPRDLSTGQQRALAIALQLHDGPRTLLIDEPTRGLDRRACVELAQVLTRVSHQGTRVIIATHDPDFAALINARVLTLSPHLVPLLASHLAPAVTS